MVTALYLDTSAVLRATLESGMTPSIEAQVAEAGILVVSRLAQVEAARVLHRVRLSGVASEARLADVEREIDAIWTRCEIWALTPTVCELARAVVPTRPLRTLDALHLATYLLARRRIEGLILVTEDDRLRDAALGG